MHYQTYPLLQRANILFLNEKPLFLNNKQWTTAAAIVCIYTQFFQSDISDNPNFSIDINLKTMINEYESDNISGNHKDNVELEMKK